MKDYKIIYSGGSGEITEKKSRFIANIFPVESEEEAAKIIEAAKKKYWDARHNCYAFVLKNGVSRCSDDGEPAGTAGRPILEVITGAQIYNILIIVTRYFGGTLLGTGGLVRAYSKAAQEGIAASQVVEKKAGQKITIKTDYSSIGKLQYITAQMGIAVLSTSYGEHVEMELAVSGADAETFIKKTREALSGQADINTDSDIYFAVIDGKPVLFGQEQA